MKLRELDYIIRKKLDFEIFNSIDNSMNGIQVGDENQEITKIAFSVDACMDSFIRTKQEKAELLFVHHGLFWGQPIRYTGKNWERMKFLLNNNISLYACHLPLDQHPEVGNNARMAEILNLQDRKPFGEYHGQKIGFKGNLPQPLNMEDLVNKLFGSWDYGINALRFGKNEISSVGIISGGGIYEVYQAIDEGLDLFITGDNSHNIYHGSKESGINVLFAGHYLTEIFGVQAMADFLNKETNLDTVFIDIPTGY